MISLTQIIYQDSASDWGLIKNGIVAFMTAPQERMDCFGDVAGFAGVQPVPTGI